MGFVKFTNIIKKFGETPVLKDLSLEINQGEFLVLVGPSGCGKSTLLRILAGFEAPTSGDVGIGGHSVLHTHPKDREIAMVFQNYALYPHMTVEENLKFGLKLRKIPMDEIEKKTLWAAETLRLTEHLKKKPGQLSGGQKQRVAMGRAMVKNPKVFLFDEPLSNLDAQLRLKMRSEIALLHKKMGTTTIYVTHDQVEAMTLADRIAVMKDGVFEQIGTPTELYLKPETVFVAGFMGSPAMNILDCQRLPKFKVPPEAKHLGIRPEALRLEQTELRDFLQIGVGFVFLVERLGLMAQIHLKVEDTDVVVLHRNDGKIQLGDRLDLWMNPNQALFFDGEGKRVL